MQPLGYIIAFLLGLVVGYMGCLWLDTEPAKEHLPDYHDPKSKLLASNQFVNLHERRKSKHPYHGTERRSHSLPFGGEVQAGGVDVWDGHDV